MTKFIDIKHLPPEVQQIYRNILYGLLAVLVITLIGMFGYKLIDPYASWIDCLYMSFITVTTVGYGEVVDLAGSPVGRVFTMFILGAGLCALWFCFSAFTALLMTKDLNLSWRRRSMEQHIRKLHGHYIICGYGRVGRNVGSELDMAGQHYVAIDREDDMLEQHKAFKQPGLLYLSGDASDDALLRVANIEEAAGVFAVTGDDSLNLMIVMSARHLNPQVRIVARCHEVRNFDKITRAGADNVISPDFTGGMRIASAMIRPTVVNFLDEMMHGRNNLRVDDIEVPQGFTACTLADLNMQRGADFVLLAVRNGEDWQFNPEADYRITAGMALIVMASPSGRVTQEQLLLTRIG